MTGRVTVPLTISRIHPIVLPPISGIRISPVYRHQRLELVARHGILTFMFGSTVLNAKPGWFSLTKFQAVRSPSVFEAA